MVMTLDRPPAPPLRAEHPGAFLVSILVVLTIVPSTLGGLCFALLNDDISLQNCWLAGVLVGCLIALSNCARFLTDTACRTPSNKVKVILSLGNLALLTSGGLWATTSGLAVDRFTQVGWHLLLLGGGATALTLSALFAVFTCRAHIRVPTGRDR